MSAICMKTTTSFRLILSGVGIFLLLTCVDGTVVRRPQNTAQILGQRVVLDCECDHPIKDILTWGYSNVSEGDVWYNIALCQEGETPSPGYSLNMSKLNSCDLIIERVTAEQAGRYRCSESIGGGEPADSHLIVLATEPLCTTAPSDFINVTDMVTLSCSVKCSGTSDVDPVMTWFDSSGQQLSARNIGSDLSPNYISNVTATIPIVEQYTCETSFVSVPSTGTPGSADNKPTYTSTCYTQPLTVWYPPFKENISIEYEGSSDQSVGSLVFCTGHSVPPVNLYEWRLDDEIKSMDSKLTLDVVGENLTYMCTVWNQIGSNSDQISLNVIPIPELLSTTQPDGNVTDYSIIPTMTSCFTQPCSDCEDMVLGLTMGLGVPLLLSVVLHIVMFTRRNKQEIKTPQYVEDLYQYPPYIEVENEGRSARDTKSPGNLEDPITHYTKLSHQPLQQPAQYEKLTTVATRQQSSEHRAGSVKESNGIHHNIQVNGTASAAPGTTSQFYSSFN